MTLKKTIALAAAFLGATLPALAKELANIPAYERTIPALGEREVQDRGYVRYHFGQSVAVFSDTVRLCLNNGQQVVAFLETEMALAPNLNTRSPLSAPIIVGTGNKTLPVLAATSEARRWDIRTRAMQAVQTYMDNPFVTRELTLGLSEGIIKNLLVDFSQRTSAYDSPVNVTLAYPLTTMPAPSNCEAPQVVSLPQTSVSTAQTALRP
jgi:hypothetical protein